MGPVDAFWHIVNFLAPGLVVAALTSLVAKGLWRRELRTVAWTRLFLSSSVLGLSALVAGLVVFGHDGHMATYALLVAASALAVWLAGFVLSPRRKP